MGKKRIQMLILSLVVPFCNLILGSTVFGAPSLERVSGTITDGGTITITGSGFGEHDDYGGAEDYLPFIFEDCEAGVVDASKGWQGYGRMVTSNNRSGSSYNIYHEKNSSGSSYTTILNTTSSWEYRYGLKIGIDAPVHNYFFSQWIRLADDFAEISACGSDCQTKMLMSTPSNTNGNNKDYFQTRGDTTPPLRTETESGQTSLSHGAIENYMPYGTWHRMDMWVSVPDSTTGHVDEIKWWIDGKLIREGKQLGYLQTVVNEVGLISFVGYMSGSGFSLQTDDHFIDFTMARVEISDSPVWDDTVQTHKEIQAPTSWADYSIEFEAKTSSFPADTPLYLYVVDSNGAVNHAGFLLGDETVPPTAEPTGSIPQSVKGFLAVQ